jgi:predicted glycogen debranching enzyme
MNFEGLIEREWIVANGLGGYASSTLCGLNTRKYHGLLVGAMSPPVRRMVLLSHVEETLWTPHGEFQLGNNEYPGTIFPRGFTHLRAFSVEPFPRWAYQGDGFTIEKSLRLLRGENTVCISYSLLTGGVPVTLEVKALLALRGIHELMYQWNSRLAAETKRGGMVRVPASTRTPEVFFAHDGEFRSEPHWHLNTIYRREDERGYSGLEDLWKPGTFRWMVSPGRSVHLICSTEPVELAPVIQKLERAREDLDRRTAIVNTETNARLEMLSRAAESFVLSLPTETPSTAKESEEASRSVHVIGQYPWGPPSGRAALIGFTGLFLAADRAEEGRSLLHGLAARIRDGMIPTEFPEDGESPLYHGVDTSLWFVSALGEYFAETGDEKTVGSLFSTVENIIETYRRTDGLAVACQPDGLVESRLQGVATSWMDAQLAEGPVTPRKGETVELNALWFNALVIASRLAKKNGKVELAAEWEDLSQKVQAAFNRKFWNESLNCCYDVIGENGADATIRPNQIFAASLLNPVLLPERRKAVVQKLIDELLTQTGVRSLWPRDPSYKGQYGGNVVSRDRAQHQGSAYPWLLGPLVTAYLKLNGRSEQSIAKVLQWLAPSLEWMQGDGLGQLSELCDGDASHKWRGAPASALSAAEMLRCYAREVLGISSARSKAQPPPEPRPGHSIAAPARP